MLRAQNLSKAFRQRSRTVGALRDVSLRIERGEFVSIVGPSGSGKSTLLLTLGGLVVPSEGKVLWDNQSVYDWQMKRRAWWRSRKVGFVFQSFNLVPYLTALENVKLALAFSENGGEESNETALRILYDVQLADRLHHLPAELSIGQQQRVAVARAIVKDPEMILGDEPTGNLDPDTAREVMALLTRAHDDGKTVVVVTHDPSIAAMADRSIRIVDGEIAECSASGGL
jgi:putative ABC transport system ATP-binding protein